MVTQLVFVKILRKFREIDQNKDIQLVNNGSRDIIIDIVAYSSWKACAQREKFPEERGG